MARKRFQQGHVYEDHHGIWKGRFREDVLTDEGVKRVHREIILGTKKELPTKRLAERRLLPYLAKVNSLGYRPARVATFNQFLEIWEPEILSKQKPSAARATRSHLRCHIKPILGDLRMEEFYAENQQRFVTKLCEKGASRKTVRNILSTLSSILATARRWGYNCIEIRLNDLALPARGVTTEARHFTLEQLRRILALAVDPWRTLFAILAMTGLRAGEALGLQIGDVDFTRNTIAIRRSAWCGRIQTPKTTASETVLPMPGALSRILGNHIQRLDGRPGTFLFTTRNNRPPSSNKVVEYQLWPLLDALNITRCGLHAFRHSHTALLLDSGANPKIVQRQLRHADPRVTLGIYGHLVGDAHRQAVESVAAILDANVRPTGAVN